MHVDNVVRLFSTWTRQCGQVLTGTCQVLINAAHLSNQDIGKRKWLVNRVTALISIKVCSLPVIIYIIK